MQELASWIQLYQTPTGRRMFAHRGVLVVLEDHPDLDGLKTHVVGAVAHDEHTRSLELAWATAKKQDHVGPEAMKLDYELDRLLGNLHDMVSSIARSPLETLPIASAAKVLEELFPSGVAAITQTTHEDEVSAVEVILKRLEGDLAPEVERLNITAYIPRLKSLAAELKAELTKREKDKLSFDVVRAAQEKGQGLYLETVARVLGAFPSASEADTKARAALLTPIWRQNEALRASRSRRRQPVDVDPQTGEPVE